MNANIDAVIAAIFNLLLSDGAGMRFSMITPYVIESDMAEIRGGFNSDKNGSPWGYVHDGFDIYPQDNLKPFRAVCSGRVHWIYTGSEQVVVMLACNSSYTAEYNFETQSPQTGSIQLQNIMVVQNQPVSQGSVIGYLYTPVKDAHVHFGLHKNWVSICPEVYLSQEAAKSMLNLSHVTYPGANLCYGGDVAPPSLVTPYVNESDMTEINAGFSYENSGSPWGNAHNGIAIYPQGDLKLFQSTCSGIVDSVDLRQVGTDPDWQVEVRINCDIYVDDPFDGGYFNPFSTVYIFKPMSDNQVDGQTQLAKISVNKGDVVSQGEPIGRLKTAGSNAHLQFDLEQYGGSDFSALGIKSIPICPEPHFSTSAKDSVLDLLHIAWPGANLCYQY